MNQLFIYASSSTNPVQVELSQKATGSFKQIYLKQYSITGVPVTAGVPDNLFYTIDFDNTASPNQHILRTDHKRGFPLRLTGLFTTEVFDTPVLIADFGNNQVNQTFKLNISTPTGNNDATYTSLALWLEYK
jgi:hypothetical protein